ncbi:MAG: pyridoxine 5'-phosphate synthase [candidate division WOR-3 bacterium]|uniref:Pyridoxine 5'-phosphate synthase n=1 Tax=candidate division WOR-3 bacterium TaxID=2052148 RepID=A0A7C1SD24_UNCW3|nr:pyridoxine 5'-phosphate synthase [candidate division WOR-3 bacterium]
MRLLSVNIDHIATLRQARRENFPDPVQAATLAELGGADGITVHLRQDQRHINFRDVRLLRQTIKTELTVEAAPVTSTVNFLRRIKPAQVTLVPEVVTEITTTKGLDVIKQKRALQRIVASLKRSGVRVCIFVEPDPDQIKSAAEIGAQVVELNTDLYSKDLGRRDLQLRRLKIAAEAARTSGLTVHVGHGLNYSNVVPILEENIAQGFSIGFAIIARAVFVGLKEAVFEMKRIIQEVRT